MLYVVWLLWSNLDFAAGAAADTTVFRLIHLKYRNPARYEIVGRVVLEDSHER